MHIVGIRNLLLHPWPGFVPGSHNLFYNGCNALFFFWFYLSFASLWADDSLLHAPGFFKSRLNFFPLYFLFKIYFYFKYSFKNIIQTYHCRYTFT